MVKATLAKSTVTSHPHRGWGSRLRSVGIGFLLIVGCLGFGVYVVVHWAEHQILNTDNWVALVSPLPKQPVVYTALGSYVSKQVFAPAQIEKEITDALPERASFLASPLTDQLQNLTTRLSQKVISSDAFQTVWTGANRLAMNRLLTKARGTESSPQAKVHDKFDIDISSVASQLKERLGSSATAIPALQSANKPTIKLDADLQSKPRRIHQAVRAVDNLATTLPLFVIACWLGALALSHKRRRTAIKLAVVLVVVILLELVAIKWGRQEILNQVRDQANLPAVMYIFDTLVSWLRHMMYIVLILILLALGVLLLAGPATWASRARTFLHLQRMHSSKVILGWHAVRLWVRQWEYYLLLATVMAVLIITTFLATVNGRVVVNALLLLGSIYALLHILATPPQLYKTDAQ